MDVFFDSISQTDILPQTVIGICMLGLVIIKITNPGFVFNTVGFVGSNNSTEKTKQATNTNKSDSFSLLGTWLLISLSFYYLTGENYWFCLVIGFFLVAFFLLNWFVVNQLLVGSGDLSIFFFKKIKQLQALSIIIMLPLIINEFIFNSSFFVSIVLAFGFLLMLYKTVSLLLNKLSLFHIILYICSLEILPVLILLKWVSNL